MKYYQTKLKRLLKGLWTKIFRFFSISRRPLRFPTGFTLIELLVAISVISILSIIVFINYRAGEQSLLLDQSAVILGQNIRRAQEMALSSKEFHNIIPAGGYGVYLKTDDDFYIIFADCDNNHQYTTLINNTCNGFPEKVEQITFDKRGKILSLFSGSSLSILNIIFVPPSPTVIMSGTGAQAVITLSLKEDSSVQRTVRVNKAGLIEAF